MLLALLSSATLLAAPPALAATPTYTVSVRLTHGATVDTPRLVARSGEASGFVVSPGPQEGWLLKVLPTADAGQVRVGLDLAAWAGTGAQQDRGRATTEVKVAPGEVIRLDLPEHGGRPAYHAEVTVTPA